MHTKHFLYIEGSHTFDHSSERKELENSGDCLPRSDVAVLPIDFVVESVDLGK